MNIVIIGSGNVATVLGRLIKSAGHMITEIVSRQLQHAQLLAEEVNAKPNTNPAIINKDADIYIMAVSDTAIENIVQKLQVPGKIIVHTSGALPKNVLQKASDKYGVLYPLQSLRKEATHIPAIPFMIDGSDGHVTEKINLFAETFTSSIRIAGDEERLKLHVAAVVVSNFTNHLYTLTKEYCEKEHTDFNLLAPLIFEVANRVAEYDPKEMQTGPAIREDDITIKKHLQLLSAYPQLEKLYREISESIKGFYHK